VAVKDRGNVIVHDGGESAMMGDGSDAEYRHPAYISSHSEVFTRA
jgi:hypothetical protein